jgi:hypothetical protein
MTVNGDWAPYVALGLTLDNRILTVYRTQYTLLTAFSSIGGIYGILKLVFSFVIGRY